MFLFKFYQEINMPQINVVIENRLDEYVVQ